MIEMQVLAVRRCPRTGKPVAILEPAAGGSGPRLALPLSKAEAHALLHELHDQGTMRGQAFALMGRVLASLQGKVSAVEVMPVEDGTAAASLQVDSPSASIRIPVELGPALSLAVGQRVPLRASEALVPTHAYADDAQQSDKLTDEAGEVPDAFLRAFDE